MQSSDQRLADPYVDRRCGDGRRAVYDSNYFDSGGLERRSGQDRRQQEERRDNCLRVSQWSSVCPEDQ